VSAANVELVRSLHPPPGTDLARTFRDEARWTAVAAAFAPVLAPDFRCAAHGYLEGDGETFEGLEGLRYLWLEWLSPWASYRTEIEDLVDLGERVLVLVRDFGTRTGEEHEIADSAAAIWTVREGELSEIRFCAERATAFRIVGLER
jgi:ketosteroid isomerase-like protein